MNATWTLSGPWYRRRVVFSAGELIAERGLRVAEHEAMKIKQRDAAVAVLYAPDDLTYWWCMGRFFWEDDCLTASDVYALVYDRQYT